MKGERAGTIATGGMENTNVNAYELGFAIRGFDCGYGGPLRPLSLANMLQEAAGLHAESLGVGKDDMKKLNRTWMLSRLEIRVDRAPREGERVVVATWPAGFDRLFALRDFEMTVEGRDEPIVRACYAYLVIDFAARRPLRPENAIAEPLRCDRPRALPDASFTVRKTGSAQHAFTVRACPRHIDYNGHVNNAHILSWLADAVPMEQHGTGELASMRVEFAAEAVEGDELQAAWAPLPGGSIMTELKKGDTLAAKAEIRWI